MLDMQINQLPNFPNVFIIQIRNVSASDCQHLVFTLCALTTDITIVKHNHLSSQPQSNDNQSIRALGKTQELI